jgi:hypothetical protein
MPVVITVELVKSVAASVALNSERHGFGRFDGSVVRCPLSCRGAISRASAGLNAILHLCPMPFAISTGDGGNLNETLTNCYTI